MPELDKTSSNFSTLTGQIPSETNAMSITTNKPIGYADGYSKIIKKTGAHYEDGTYEEVITKQPQLEHGKSTSPELLLDIQSNKFRRIPGYSTSKSTESDLYEDPTYLIFDLAIVKIESPLFREDVIGAFMNEYASTTPEIAERVSSNIWGRFTDLVLKIFPSDSIAESDGSKQHYIEAVGGLDVLLNPIINYPEDKITFTITEDIAMTLQYLSELYNNLVYSYDTHRYLIPDNLLRFNMRLTIRELRNMRIPDWTTSPVGSNSNDNVSKFIYVLHDCQFDFSKTRNFTSEMRRGGFGSGAAGLSTGGVIEMNFKSYSKIMAPLLIDNSIVLDFRERESIAGNAQDLYKNKGDYKTKEEVQALEVMGERNSKVTYRSPADIITTSNQNKRPGDIHFPDINTSIRGFASDVGKEIVEVRDVIIKQVYEEVNKTITAGERILGNKLGFTLGKTNVYYLSLREKAVTRFAWMFETLLRGEVKELEQGVVDLGKVWLTKNDLTQAEKESKTSSIYQETVEDMKETGEDTLRSYYDPNYDRTKPLQPTNVYNKPGNKSDMTSNNVYDEDSSYNQKYPDGDVHIDGQYNQKYPNGDVHLDGTYNEKYPEGDVNPNGTYNEKYPEGDLHIDGQYNQKFPEGDVNPDGQYNQKFPEGDVNPDGQYNQKFPEGDVNPDGTYNEKYPKGDVHPDGQYNEKYPKGDIQPDGTYNEKYPKGDIMPKGSYNNKYPKGDIQPDGTYNEKYPKGDIMPKGTYNEKYPKGDIQPDGTYNEKYPKGDIQPDGTYNIKQPQGRVQIDGQYNDKYPEGDVHPDGTYNQKLPKGRVEEDGIYNDNPPIGNIYNKKLPPNKDIKLGNVNKQK